jgi:hypothetical protein
MMPFMLSRICIFRTLTALACFVIIPAVPAFAQSTDVRFPTPIDQNEVAGSIAARDIGDARLTDHFYTFNGLPGDLLITVESKNLNGDFDVFTAGELRPVVKLVVYAESSSAVTKNIYLRKAESLILRVEGRTPNDDEGSYRIRFSGTFQPIQRSLAVDTKTAEEPTLSTAKSTDRKTTRVNSAGARIEEPVEVAAAAPTPAPTPVEPKQEPAAKPAKVETARNTRGTRRPPIRRTTTKPAETATVKKQPAPAPADTTTKSPTEESATETTAAPVGRTTPRKAPPRSTRGTTRTVKNAPTAESGQLVIEVNDGTRIHYAMSNVAKVTIENGEVVITINDGYVKRVPLTSILRMSIGP